MSDASDNPVDFSPVRFLIVDEVADARRLLASMLLRCGARQIDQAAFAAEALRRIAHNSYDVVLCDYHLGAGRDGQQLLEEARHRGLFGTATLFVMVTAENTAQAVMEVLDCRPDDYLARPFTRRQFAARIGHLLRRRQEFGAIERALEEQRCEHALALCDARLAAGGVPAPQLLRLKVDACIALERYEEAEAICARVFGGSRAAWAGLGSGRIRYRQGDYIGAAACFRQILAAHPRQLEAYDWLARTEVKLGDREAARGVLATALELSPRSIRRQMALGELALRDGQYRLAARAFGAAVALGGRSVYRSASNYIKQARALMHIDARDALRVLRELRRDFGADPEARLRAAAAECLVHRRLGAEAAARAAHAEALRIYAGIRPYITPEAMVELAHMLLAHGEAAAAIEYLQRAVANRHEDETLLQEVRAVFHEAGMAEEGEGIITRERDRVVRLNNEGVRLAEDGRLEAAIALFQQALRDLPANRTINMNAAKVLLLRMQRDGPDADQLRQARECLLRLQQLDPAAGAVQRLAAMYRAVAGTG